MNETEVNPYHPPASENATEESNALPANKLLVLTFWSCSLFVAGYGLIGTVLNGLDLVRTQSLRDFKTEGKLVLLLVFGLVLCWSTNAIANQKRTLLIPSHAILLMVGVAWVFYDMMK